jgi:hypothetical protein
VELSLSSNWLKFGLVAHAFLWGYALPPSVAAQESDARQVSMAIDGEIERDENKAAAILYVGAAKKSDVEGMLSMISPILPARSRAMMPFAGFLPRFKSPFFR